MDTYHAEKLVPHCFKVSRIANKIYCVLHAIWEGDIEKDDLNTINEYLPPNLLSRDNWYLIDFENEIRTNLLHGDTFQTTKYLHYLSKIYNTVQHQAWSVIKYYKRYRREVNFKRFESEFHSCNRADDVQMFDSYEEFLGYAEFTFRQILLIPGGLYRVICDEFELTNQQWKTLQTIRKETYGEFLVPQHIAQVGKVISSSPFITGVCVDNDVTKKDRLSTKQQILLLQTLGIFDLPQICSLTEKKRGILFGNLLNRHEKNAEDTIRNRFDESQFSISDKKIVSELLEKVGIDNFSNFVATTRPTTSS
jgi:hypothetical protein